MRKRCPIEVVDERVVVMLDGLRALLDTSFATSVGNGRPVGLLGRTYQPPLQLDGVDVPRIAAVTGTELDLVLGCDILAEHVLLVDRPNGFVIFSAVPLVLGEASERLDLERGIPVVDIRFEGSEARAVLATGARLSYMDPDLAAEHPPSDTQREAHPVLGAFDTGVRRLEVALGEYEIEDAFGVLPDTPGERLLPAGVRWILGGAVLREGPVLLDLAGGTVSFAGD